MALPQIGLESFLREILIARDEMGERMRRYLLSGGTPSNAFDDIFAIPHRVFCKTRAWIVIEQVAGDL